MNRSISSIAYDIKRVWAKPYFGAKPYLDAMTQLNSINDKYFHDDAKSVIMYFLANASTFRGNDAKVLKAELKEMLKH
jgi:hypothetical protein|tara:strand:- start:443 stop:676 length:234 start_codon:yes stop_codon:yes gene_type:complete